jgi:hypothetical protein
VRWLAVTLAVVMMLAAPVAAAPRTVAVVPLSTLGAEVSSANAKKITTELEAGLAGVAEVTVVGSAAVSDAIKKAKQQRLSVCAGDPDCLGEVGALVGAELIVYAELGGLGDTQIVYLTLIDAKLAREVRTTRIDVAALLAGGGRSAAVRLLDPARYTGQLQVDVDVVGASVYVNGKLIGKSPIAAKPFAVGTHALRVTHPEYRDFVRFVDVEFDQTAVVKADLHEFPIVQTDVEDLGPGTKVNEIAPRWYRSWWAVAAFGVVAFSGALLIADFAGCRGICPKPDFTRPVDPPPDDN